MSCKHGLKVMVFWSILLCLSACAHPVSKEMGTKAEEDDSAFTRVLKDPTSYVGSIILWGGKIIETLNYPTGTEILVLETPVDDRGLPGSEDHSHGRFIARTAKFLDPGTYAKGKWITVRGEIAGAEIMPLGKRSYTCPVVEIRKMRLWGQRPPPLTRSPWPPRSERYDREQLQPGRPPYDWPEDMGIE
ncbi:MAG: Slp family lipoprotein [Deltaproteobacteria bacterium]